MALNTMLPLQTVRGANDEGHEALMAQMQQNQRQQQEKQVAAQQAQQKQEYLEREDWKASQSGFLWDLYRRQPSELSQEAKDAALNTEWQRIRAGAAGARMSNGKPMFSPQELSQFPEQTDIGTVSRQLAQSLGAKGFLELMEGGKQDGQLPTAAIQNYEKGLEIGRTKGPGEQKRFEKTYVRPDPIKEIGGVQTQVSPTGDLNPLSTLSDEQVAKRRLTVAAKRGEFDVELVKEQPKVLAGLESLEADSANADKILDGLIARADVWTTGVAGQVLSKIAPGSEAWDVAADITSLEATQGIEENQRMRRENPTGTALGGSTSDKDLAFLIAKVRNVKNSQSRGQFLRNLRELKEFRRQMLIRSRRNYNRIYGRLPKLEEQDYDQADLEFTAQKHGISVDEVKKRLSGEE